MIILIQIIGIIFGLFMLYTTFLHLKRKEFTAKESLVWFMIWIALIIISIKPTLLDFLIIDLLKLSRRLDFFVIVSIIFMLGVLYYIYGIIRDTQRKVEKLVRDIAIKEKKQKK